MDQQTIPPRLDSLYSDITLQIALFLGFDDLASLALTCKSLYEILCCSEVYRHWIRHIPPAFLPIKHSPFHPNDYKVVSTAIRQARMLRSAWSSPAGVQPKKSIEISESYWSLHIPQTRWMFTFGKSETQAYLRCIDLMTGAAVGDMDLGYKHPSHKLLTGQTHGKDQVLLSYLYEGVGDDNAPTWDIVLVVVNFTDSGSDGLKAQFSTLRTLRVPSALAQPFARFDVAQIEGNYIILAGNWSSKRFLFIDWSNEVMTVHSFSKLWKTFDWRLLNGSLIVVYDDRQVSNIDVAQVLASNTQTSGTAEFASKTLLTVPSKGNIEFIKRDDTSFCAVVVKGDPGQSYDLCATRITTRDDGSVCKSQDPFDKLELRPRFPDAYSPPPLYVGSCVVFLDDLGPTVYISNGSGRIHQKTITLPNRILAVITVDEEIGMIAVRESDAGRSCTRVYWLV